MGLAVRNAETDKDPLDRDHRRIESIPHLCYLFDSRGSLVPWQVMTVFVRKIAEDCLETERALAVVESVAQLFQANEVRTAREIGDALKRQWSLG
jgi:hypothetical protein